MLVAVLTAFCGVVAGYFCWVTLGFSIALTNTPPPTEWASSFSIAWLVSLGLMGAGIFCYLLVKYNDFNQKPLRLIALPYSGQRGPLCSKWLMIGVVLSAAAGVAYSVNAHNQFAKSRVQTSQIIDMEGVIVGLPDVKEDKVTFLFRTGGVAKTVKGERWALLRVTWMYPGRLLEPGQIWRLPLRLKPVDSVNVSGVAYVRKEGGGAEKLGNEFTYHSLRFQFKNKLLSTLNKYISSRNDIGYKLALLQPGQLKALLLALLLGDRSLLTPIDWALLSDTGTTHLIAISGLHIGLVASFTYFLVLNGFRLFRVSSIGAAAVSGFHLAHLAALFTAWGYGALAGYSVPTQRACLTVTVVIILRLVYPVINPWLAVLVSASVVLLFDPIAVLSASFWLTFVAVVFIFVVLQGRIGRLSILSSWTRVQLALFVGLLPLSIGYFGKVSLLSIFANLVAVPVVGWLIVPLAFFYSALIHVGIRFEAISYGVIELLEGGVGVLMLFLEEIQSWGAVMLFPSPENEAVWLAVLGAAILCLPKGLPGKGMAFVMIIPLLAPILVSSGRGLLGNDVASEEGGDYINEVFPARGQGLVIDVLPSHSMLMVVDQGHSLLLIGSNDMTAYKIQYQFIRYLQRKGIKNELGEPVFSMYRQWVSKEYFVLNIQLKSRPLMQWAAVNIESLPVCGDENVEIGEVTIGSLVGAGNCQLLLSGKKRRHLIARPGSIQHQLAFVDNHKSHLVDQDIDGLLLNVNSESGHLGSAASQSTDYWLSGALLNTVNPKYLVLIGGEVFGSKSRNTFNTGLLSRLAARSIEIKEQNSQGMLLKL